MLDKSLMFTNHILLFLFLFLFVICTGSEILHSKEIIQWLWYEQTPYFMAKDPSVGHGVGDRLTSFYQKNLPEYQHQNVKVNTLRYDVMIKKDNVCVPVAWLSANERELLVHTRPHTLEPPVGIYIHKSKQKYFGEPGKVLSLKELIKKDQFRLGVLRGMEYSAEVDHLIAQNSERENVMLIEAIVIQIDLQMLKLNRLDYLLGLPSQKTLTEDNGTPDEFLFYNIKEISKFIPIYTHCSNTKTGNDIIKKLNKLLTNEYLDNSIESYEYWYGKNKLYRKLFTDHIIYRAPNPLISDM